MGPVVPWENPQTPEHRASLPVQLTFRPREPVEMNDDRKQGCALPVQVNPELTVCVFCHGSLCSNPAILTHPWFLTFSFYKSPLQI